MHRDSSSVGHPRPRRPFIAGLLRRTALVVAGLLVTAVAVGSPAPGASGADDISTSRSGPPSKVAHTPVEAKLRPGLERRLAHQELTDFWVEFRGHPHLAAAAKIKDWSARGEAVVSELRSTAQTGQADAIATLKSAHVRYTSLYIDDSIYVHDGSKALAERLAADPAVSAVRAPRTYRLPEPAAGKRSAQVDSVEWGIAAIHADRVWDEYDDTGQGIVIGSIDSGVQFDHPALVSAYRGNNGDGSFSHDHNWYDPAQVCGSPSLEPCDNNGHGTHTVGTMVGDDGAGNRIGVAPGAQWIAAKGCETNACSDLSLGLAAQWMLAPTALDGSDPDPSLRPNIINNSWSSPPGDAWYEGYVQQWVAAGIFPAFALGNRGPECATQDAPGEYPEAYAVGAVDESGDIASFSSRGSDAAPEAKPDIVAPGTDVRSSVPGDQYAVYNGTSMATPHVSGAVALIWSVAPSLVGDVAATRAILDTTAHDHADTTCGGTAGDNNVYGEGLLDVYDAVGASPRSGTGQLTGTITDEDTGAPLAGAKVKVDGPRKLSTRTGEDGTYHLYLDAGDYGVTVSAYGYRTQTIDEVEIRSEQATTRDVALVAAAQATLSGLVRDGSGHRWPLYAAVTVEDVPGTWYTDPDSGRFAIDLPAGATYRVTVTPQAAGYTAKTQDVTIDDGDVAEDFLVPIDTGSCTAPGYAPSFDGARATFDTTTLPEGWGVVDHEGSGLVWRLDDPADRGNLTGGDGGFATLDSDYYTNTGKQDSSLVSPAVDLSDAEHPVVEFANDFRTLAGVQADLDVSLDQGASWQTVWTRNTDARGPVTVRVPIPQAAGHPDVVARWHYHEGHWTGWWQVDDAFLGERTCRKVHGGLVHGQVTDANTGTPVVGATVTSEDDPSARATTIATPGDNALPDGYFSVFSPEVNDHQFSASMPRYQSDARTVHVATDWSTRADFALAAGLLVMKPHQVGGRATLGKDVTRRVTITNTGTAPATYRFAESQLGFVIQRADGTRSTSQQLMASQGSQVRYVRNPTITPAAELPETKPASDPAASAAGAPAAAPWLGIADYPTTIKDSAAGYHDGRVYSFGGTVSGYGPTPASYVYDPATLEWSALADMPDGRQKPASAFVDGKFYVVGGWGAAGSAEASTLVYDPAVDRWTTAADNPHPSGAVGSAVLDGKIYSVGGCSGDCQSASREVTAYDVATNRFETLAPYPEEISWPSCGGIDGKVYCAGGLTAGPKSSERAYAYDPQADSWTPVAELPVDLWGSSYAVANGQLVVSGGAARDGSMLTNETFAYDPSTDAWTDLPPSNDAVYRGAAACGFTKIGGGSGARVIAWSETLPGYDDCEEAGTDAAWLREGRIHGALAPHHSVTVTLKLDAGRVSQPGVYRARLIARTNTPYDAPSSSVRLTAVAPSSWARLGGQVLGKACDGTRDPLPGATLAVDRGKSSWTLMTDADGAYALWVPGRNKPARLVGARDGYRPSSSDVRLRPGRRVTRTLVLRRLGC